MTLIAKHMIHPPDHFAKIQFCRPALQPHLRPAYQIVRSTSQEAVPINELSPIITFEEVQDIAQSRGVCISLKELGPAYRIVCRDTNEQGDILAVTNGFIVPIINLMHCDTLQIFTKGKQGTDGERIRGGVLGLGLLVGGATFAFGYEKGCRKAEILAINDDDSWHERLVKYYSRFGFEKVKVVQGSRLSDLPDMLVWGGAGTRMDADIPAMLKRWTRAIRNSKAKGGPAAIDAVE